MMSKDSDRLTQGLSIPLQYGGDDSGLRTAGQDRPKEGTPPSVTGTNRNVDMVIHALRDKCMHALSVASKAKKDPNLTEILTELVTDITLYMDKECSRIQLNSPVSRMINSIFDEQNLGGAWRRYNMMWTEFIIKVWPSTGMSSFDFVILEDVEQLVDDIESEIQRNTKQATKTSILPAPTLTQTAPRITTSLPTFVQLENTDVLISQLPAKVTEGIDASYLKIKLLELPRYNVETRKDNINIYGLQDRSREAKFEHDTAQSILQMSNNLNSFDPDTQPEKAIEWLRRMEELTKPNSAELGLYIITLSANESFRAKLITLIGLAMMQELSTTERLRWALASLKIEFSRNIYSSKAAALAYGMRVQNGESLVDFAIRISETMQKTMVNTLGPEHMSLLKEKFYTGITDLRTQSYLKAMEGNYSCIKQLAFELQKLVDAGNIAIMGQLRPNSIVLNAVETRQQKRVRLDDQEQRAAAKPWEINKGTAIRVDEAKERGFQKRGRECRRCYATGHNSINCDAPEPSKVKDRCMRCGWVGHNADECEKVISPCGRCWANHDACVCPNARISLRRTDKHNS